MALRVLIFARPHYLSARVRESPTWKNDILKYHIFIEKRHILVMKFKRYHLKVLKNINEWNVKI